MKLDFTSDDAAGAPVAQVAIAAITRTAAASGNRVGLVRISRTGSQDNDLNVALVVGGTAVGGVDYSALPATVTIPAGQSSVAITVDPLGTQFQGVKKVKLHVSPGSDYVPLSGSDSTKVKIVQ